MSIILSRDEIKELTSRTHRATQARVLTALGVPFKVHPETGALLVSRTAADAALGGRATVAANDDEPAREWTVDVEAIGGGKRGTAPAAR